MILVIVFAVIAFFIYFLLTTDSSFNMWLAIRFGTSEAAFYCGKTIWVVGCSSGIGEQMVLQLAQYAKCVVLSARREELLKDLAKRCTEINKKCETVVLPFDITHYDTLAEKCKKAVDAAGKIDVVVLNCGVSQRADVLKVQPSVDEACFAVNALGPIALAREMVKNVRSENGVYDRTQFLVVSSLAGVVPAIVSPSYSAAKHALMGYFRTLHLELNAKGIRVSIACPSLTYAPNNNLTAFTDDINQKNAEVLEAPSPSHMSSTRAAELCLLTAANDIREAWFSKTINVLLLPYIFTVSPELSYRMLNFIGLDKLRKARTGTK